MNDETHRSAIFGNVELTRYDAEPLPPLGQRSLDAFLELGSKALEEATPHVWAYYKDVCDLIGSDEMNMPAATSPAEIWKHVQVYNVTVESDWDDDGPWYVTVEGNCDWDPEHGIVFVWKEGLCLTRVSGFDGHLTNSDAYDDDTLSEVVYKAVGNWTTRRAT